MKSFTVKDFSGGLNVAASPESLPANQTPDCSNVDMLESGIIKSRHGWMLSVIEAFTASPIAALHRHYPRIGSRMWAAIAAGKLWTYDGVTQWWRTVEAEAVASGAFTTVTAAGYSGGACAQVGTNETASFAVPKCSAFNVGLTTSNVRLDGGAWVASPNPEVVSAENDDTTGSVPTLGRGMGEAHYHAGGRHTGFTFHMRNDLNAA